MNCPSLIMMHITGGQRVVILESQTHKELQSLFPSTFYPTLSILAIPYLTGILLPGIVSLMENSFICQSFSLLTPLVANKIVVLFKFHYQFYILCVKKIFLKFIWERERESAHTSEGGAERKRARIPICRDGAERDVGLRLMNREVMTLAEIKSQTLNWLCHPGTPSCVFFVCSRI